MPTPEEISRRIEQVDQTRSVRRTAAAQRVGELAQRRQEIVTQLDAVERELGDVLAQAEPDISIDELATFTDLKTSDLTTWLEAGRKPGRGGGRRKRTAPRAGSPTTASRDLTAAPSTAGHPEEAASAELSAAGASSTTNGVAAAVS